MTFANNLLFGYIKVVFGVILLTLIVLHSLDVYENRTNKKRLAEIASRSFSDYAVYYRLEPVNGVEQYGAKAMYRSDMQTNIEDIRIAWEENIECDHNPHDGYEYFEFYRSVESTSKRYIDLKTRPTNEKYLLSKGFPANSAKTDSTIRYPFHDADCRLNSHMTLTEKNGLRFFFHKVSDIVKIRAQINDAHQQTAN